MPFIGFDWSIEKMEMGEIEEIFLVKPVPRQPRCF
jgi:hypothetical protein